MDFRVEVEVMRMYPIQHLKEVAFVFAIEPTAVLASDLTIY
jgi:hypothetical protein